MLVNTAFGQKKTYKPQDFIKLPIDNVGKQTKKARVYSKEEIEVIRKDFEQDMKHLKLRPDQVN